MGSAADGDGVGIDQLALGKDRRGGGGAAHVDGAHAQLRLVIDQGRKARGIGGGDQRLDLQVAAMQQKIDEQKAANAQVRQTNERLASEVHDLKEGLDMVEEKARNELGMVKPNEVYVQFTPR